MEVDPDPGGKSTRCVLHFTSLEMSLDLGTHTSFFRKGLFINKEKTEAERSSAGATAAEAGGLFS